MRGKMSRSFGSARFGSCTRNGFSCFIALLTVFTVSCFHVTSRELVGDYGLIVGDQKIELTIFPNGNFSETIRFLPNQVEKWAGTWRWESGRLNLHGLWIPKSFHPDYILEADSKAGVNQPQYSNLAVWSLPAENRFGTTILAVFPDADINFRKSKSSRP